MPGEQVKGLGVGRWVKGLGVGARVREEGEADARGEGEAREGRKGRMGQMRERRGRGGRGGWRGEVEARERRMWAPGDLQSSDVERAEAFNDLAVVNPQVLRQLTTPHDHHPLTTDHPQ